MSYTSTIPLNDNEKVVLDAQKHWFILALELFELFIAAVVPIIALLFAYNLVPSISYIVLVALLWTLIIWACMFKALTNYYLDVIRITNMRILDVDQKGLFNRDIATMRLSNIQDVNVESKGFFATIFKYGNIKIQSAGEDAEFVIRYIANPEEVSVRLLQGQDTEWSNRSTKSLTDGGAH